MKILKWVLFVIVVAPITLIGGIWVYNKAIGPEGWALDNTEKELRRQMRDPDSMVVKSHYTLQKKIEPGRVDIYICGIVDGKNSYGAYAGGTLFASRSVHNQNLGTFDTYSVQLEDPSNKRTANEAGVLSTFEKLYWNEWCVDAQHPPIAPPEKT